MRTDVPLDRAYRLLNHGPTVLVSASHGGRVNVMAAAWAMPLDFNPPKVAVVIDKSTFTRGLIEGSGRFALNLPCRAQADLTYRLGSTSGHQVDKRADPGLPIIEGRTGLPLVDGCVGWLECTLLPEPALQDRYDLFLGQVVAAQADSRVFRDGRWFFDEAPQALRTLHHVAGGAFLSASDLMQATLPTH